jgi:hypothetical protein
VFEFGWGEKLAPRIGFSYDVTGNGRAKAYASYGRYYDWTKYEMPRGSFGGDIWCIKYRAIDNPNDPITANFDNARVATWEGGGNCRDRRVPASTRWTTRRRCRRQAARAGFEVNPSR